MKVSWGSLFHSQYDGKNYHSCSKPPTRYYNINYNYITTIKPLLIVDISLQVVDITSLLMFWPNLCHQNCQRNGMLKTRNDQHTWCSGLEMLNLYVQTGKRLYQFAGWRTASKYTSNRYMLIGPIGQHIYIILHIDIIIINLHAHKISPITSPELITHTCQ